MDPVNQALTACARKRGWIDSVLSFGILFMRHNTLHNSLCKLAPSKIFRNTVFSPGGVRNFV